MRKDKARDIARGVLPSTARKGARDNKRNFHAGQRHAQRQANHAIERHLSTVSDHGTIVHDPDLFDEFEDPMIFDGYTAATTKPVGYDGHMKYVVSRRRDADKLGPLIHWAEATERQKMVGWDDADKIAYFKAILPDSLQGRHALGHVKQALDLDDDEFGFRFRYSNRSKPLTRDDIYNGLTKILANAKARAALRELLYEEIPVAGHAVFSNLKRVVREQAVDENGDRITIVSEAKEYDPLSKQFIVVSRARPKMVDVPHPVAVSVSCDVCTFMRNDPLATPAAVKRFVDILWDARPIYGRYSRPKNRPDLVHGFAREITSHVVNA
jgi:hypothetical protein